MSSNEKNTKFEMLFEDCDFLWYKNISLCPNLWFYKSLELKIFNFRIIALSGGLLTKVTRSRVNQRGQSEAAYLELLIQRTHSPSLTKFSLTSKHKIVLNFLRGFKVFIVAYQPNYVWVYLGCGVSISRTTKYACCTLPMFKYSFEKNCGLKGDSP